MGSAVTRQELIALINAAQSVPAAVRAMAGLFVMRMSDQQIATIGAQTVELKAALDRNDWEAIAKIAGQHGLPAGYVDYARNLLNQKQDQPKGQ